MTFRLFLSQTTQFSISFLTCTTLRYTTTKMSSTMIKTTENLIGKDIKFPATTAAKDLHKTMTSMEWHGKENVKVVTRPRPIITDPKDVIVKVTSTTICGSDL